MCRPCSNPISRNTDAMPPPRIVLGRTHSAQESRNSHDLLSAIEDGNINSVRSVLLMIPAADASVLTTPSLMAEHSQRTPLMAAAFNGSLVIFTTLIHHFNRVYPETPARNDEMRAQLEIQDKEGMTVAMHAAKSGSVAILSAVMGEITRTGATRAFLVHDFAQNTVVMHAAQVGKAPIFQEVYRTMKLVFAGDNSVRRLLKERDAEGMSFLMHSANPCCNFNPTAASGEISHFEKVEEDPAITQRRRGYSQGMSSLGLGDTEAQAVDPTVPVLKISIALVKECLWKEQVREELTATDLWGRTVVTHAVRSGHVQMFEAALGALRDDILDTEVEEMLQASEDERDHSPMRSALVEGGPEVQMLFVKRRGQLKKDVSARGKLATIEAKIQTFIPGKLVVIFQLLLPEIGKDHQIYLLVVLCVLAPLFNWASSLLTKERPVSSKSLGSLLLGFPAMFFWGIGTSDIGGTFGWEPALSAAALAVATICIPAVDAFLNSRSVELWYDQANQAWRKDKGAQSTLGGAGGTDLESGRKILAADAPMTKDASAQVSTATGRRILTMMSPYPQQQSAEDEHQRSKKGLKLDKEDSMTDGLSNAK
eukprot:jgi/Undpi1/12234/HiC_scaffold_5.g01910.m1